MSDGLKVKNLEAFNRAVEEWFDAVEAGVGKAAVGIAKQVLDKALINSPQYSGDYAANWKVSFSGKADDSFSTWPGSRHSIWSAGTKCIEPFSRGSMEAIEYAKEHATWPSSMKLGTPILISNSAAHDEPYAWLIEKDQIKFRTPNMGAGQVATHAVTRVARMYKTIGRMEFEALRGVGV